MDKPRNTKKVTGRAQNINTNDGEIAPKRVTFEEEKIVPSKQKRSENQKSKRQEELDQYDMSHQIENNGEYEYEDEFDDEWGKEMSFILF